jgi:hypothetical protein
MWCSLRIKLKSNQLRRKYALTSVVIISLFARLISHQPAVLFSQNEPATSNQTQPASSTLLSQRTSHQPPANRTGCIYRTCFVNGWSKAKEILLGAKFKKS